MEFKGTKGNWTVQGHSVVSDTDDITGFEERTGHLDRDYYKGNILICESVWKPEDALLMSKAPKILERLYQQNIDLKIMAANIKQLEGAVGILEGMSALIQKWITENETLIKQATEL